VTVRWDAVVERTRFWSEPEHRAPGAHSRSDPVRVQVWLFGRLAQADGERPLTLEMRHPFSVRGVIAELGRRCGRELVEKLTAPDGGKPAFFRVFADGLPIDDLDAPLETRAASPRIEMILLTGIEGG
jgi:hypothetical protein